MSLPHPRAAALPLAALLLLPLPACSPKAPPKVEYGPKVRGKVTYRGESVTYGAVLFYPHGRGPGAQASGQFVPAASALIKADGSYEVDSAPVGPVMVCVVADPEVPLLSYLSPSTGMPAPPQGAPGPGGPPQAGGPPMAEGPPMAGGPPMGGGPLMAGGPPMAGGGPPKGAAGKSPPKPPASPEVEKMSDEQKRTLKEIHDKYGTPGKSPFNFVVPPVSEPVQFNITLK